MVADEQSTLLQYSKLTVQTTANPLGVQLATSYSSQCVYRQRCGPWSRKP